MAEYDVASAFEARLPRAHGRRRSDRARWWANAGVAGSVLGFVLFWGTGYLDREQKIRADDSKVRTEQMAAYLAKLDTISQDLRALTVAVIAGRAAPAAPEPHREPAP